MIMRFAYFQYLFDLRASNKFKYSFWSILRNGRDMGGARFLSLFIYIYIENRRISIPVPRTLYAEFGASFNRGISRPGRLSHLGLRPNCTVVRNNTIRKHKKFLKHFP